MVRAESSPTTPGSIKRLAEVKSILREVDGGKGKERYQAGGGVAVAGNGKLERRAVSMSH